MFGQTISTGKSISMWQGTFNKVDELCWQLKDGINELVQNYVKFECVTTHSKKEKTALINLIAEKNKIYVINDTEKKLGPANADM